MAIQPRYGGSGGTRTPSGLTPITSFQDELLSQLGYTSIESGTKSPTHLLMTFTLAILVTIATASTELFRANGSYG